MTLGLENGGCKEFGSTKTVDTIISKTSDDRLKSSSAVKTDYFSRNHGSLLPSTYSADDDDRTDLGDGCSKDMVFNWARRTARNACSKKQLHRKLPITEWLPKYNVEKAVSDLIAGLTVGLTAIPQGIAYALVAGLPPQYGLYSAFMGCFVYCIFGSSKDITVGPTAIMALMTADRVKGKGADMAVLLSFLSGIIILTLGILRLVGTSILAVMIIFLTHSEQVNPVVRFIIGLATMFCAVAVGYAILYPTDEAVIAMNDTFSRALDQTPPIVGISLLACLFAWIHCACAEEALGCTSRSSTTTYFDSFEDFDNAPRDEATSSEEATSWPEDAVKPREEHDSKPPEKQDSKPPEKQDSKPPEKQDSKPPGQPPEEQGIKPSEQQGIKPPEEQGIKPPDEQNVKPPEEREIKPSEEQVIKQLEEQNIKPPEIQDMLPEQQDIKPPEESVMKFPKESVMKFPEENDTKPPEAKDIDIESPNSQFNWIKLPEFDPAKTKVHIKRQSQMEEIFFERKDTDKETMKEKSSPKMQQQDVRDLNDPEHQHVDNDIRFVLDCSLPKDDQTVQYIVHQETKKGDNLSECETVSNEGEQLPFMEAGDQPLYAPKQEHYPQDGAMDRVVRFADTDLQFPMGDNGGKENRGPLEEEKSYGPDGRFTGPNFEKESMTHYLIDSDNENSLYPSLQSVQTHSPIHEPSKQHFPVIFCPCPTCQDRILRVHSIRFGPEMHDGLNYYRGSYSTESEDSLYISHHPSNHHQFSHQAVDVEKNVTDHLSRDRKKHLRSPSLHFKHNSKTDNRSTVDSSISWLQNKVGSIHHRAKNDMQLRKRIFNGSVLLSGTAGSMLLRKSVSVDPLNLVYSFMDTFGVFLKTLQESTWYAANAAHPTVLGFLAASVYYSLSLLVKMIRKETSSKQEQKKRGKAFKPAVDNEALHDS